MDQLSTPDLTAGSSQQGHLHFERLLTEVSASFVNIPSDQVDAAICEAMRRIVDALGLDRSAVFQLQGPNNDLMMTHQSVLVPFKWPTVVWTGRDYPWSFRKLSNGEIAAFASLEEIADAGEREAARANGTKSRIALPLTIGGQFAGFIGFSSVRTERQWTEDIVGRLQLVASVFAGALARQRADAALRTSEARFRTLADNSSSMVWMAGLDNRASWLSRRWLEFVGHPMEHELGDGWVQGVHPADVAALLSVSVEAKGRRVPFTAEFRLRRYDGAWRWVFTHGVPNFDSEGVFQGYLGTSIDITERKLAEEAIRDLTGRLMTAQESERSRIARELHDDISQQIAGLAICLSALKRKSDTRENVGLQEEFASLRRQIACVTDSIRHLCHDLHPTVLDHGGLNPALRGHCADFARQHHIPVHFEADDDPVLDRASALCLYRVAQEALRNVARHAGAETVQVTIRKRDDDIVLTITDDGCGFDEVVTRASTSRLGLRSIHERVRLALGRCVIESAPGMGTTVSVVLPVAGGAPRDSGPRSRLMVTNPRPTVLLADDHAIVRDGVAKLLADFGFDVVGTVGDGQALLEAAKRLDPDVIVTDISMPGPVNGLDAVARLRANGCRGKIIVLTMHHDAELAAHATRAGASGYLLKHSAGEELVSAIEQALQGRVYLTPAVTRELLERLTTGPGKDAPQLTPRQREVLRLIADGMRMKEIASTLGLSTRTVETHKYEIMRILGVDSTATLVRYALEHGLIER